jgi:hypothetical protein
MLNPMSATKGICLIFIVRNVYLQEDMMKKRYSKKAGNQNKLTKETAQQALCCASTCLLPYSFPVFLRLVEMHAYGQLGDSASKTLFRISVMAHTIFPTQGILNLLLFLRPRIQERRKEAPKESLWGNFCTCLQKPKTVRRRMKIQPSMENLGYTQRTWTRWWRRFFPVVEEEEPQEVDVPVMVMVPGEGYDEDETETERCSSQVEESDFISSLENGDPARKEEEEPAVKDQTDDCAEGGRGDEEERSHRRSQEQEGKREHSIGMISKYLGPGLHGSKVEEQLLFSETA